MEDYHKKKKVVMKEIHIQTEQILDKSVRIQTEPTSVTRDRQQVKRKNVRVQTEPTSVTRDRQQVKRKNVRVQTEPESITFDDQVSNDRGYFMRRDGEIQSISLHRFDRLNLNLNREETLDPTQVAVTMESSDNAPDGAMIKNRRIVEIINEEQNATSNIMNDIKTEPDPIVGYAKEPVLPLSKACAPLIHIIHNLLFYVQMALDKTSEQPPNGLTVDESAAIRLYTSEWKGDHRSLYWMLNRTLKVANRESLRPYFKYMKLLVTAIVKLPCVSPSTTIWRGVPKDISVEFPPGILVTWWAFSSCTTALPILENNMYLGNTGNRTLFSINAINGRLVHAHSDFATEDEVLLLPGTQMIVQSQFSPACDLHIIDLKQFIPEQVLLQPPFPANGER
ncbi:unnamed protein product [Didymodactylos carnosus]|uniref:NAD(P)(+)--arginine ADP-ribosyltransferase n=1 Tax=Didymodactylos carnosus TaxID=1234261 RepID=A0A815PL26_9BILA|nr:unnamed protein product [Didymodactylos carnosus]CAF1450731.1 unnamed protein product [Didymodactylos carnosus]CAF3739993.1 unnamed protein product [Didymodactylos carnosus]CAF4324148.1 unnamed protein product [Didymodactylos carnosus]